MNELIKGLLAVIFLSMALGQYPTLQRWARREAIQALMWREPTPNFFAAPMKSKAVTRHGH